MVGEVSAVEPVSNVTASQSAAWTRLGNGSEIEKERNQCLQREHTNQEGMNAIIKADEKSKPLRESLNRLNSKRLVTKAQQRVIDIPGECWHYVKDPMFPGFPPLDWYLEEGGQ